MSALDTQVGGAMARLQQHERNTATQRWIESNVIRVPFSGCWLWDKSVCLRGGYGQVGHATYGTTKAHRLSYVAYHGDCGDGWVCHSCDTPLCVNPDHLFLGDALENHLDMVRKGRGNYVRTARLMRKLTDVEVREIRASSLSQEALGRLYGVSGATIGQARRRAQYKDVA